MKKILAVAVAVMMVMALSVSVFADTVWEYTSKVPVAIGWTTIFEMGSDDAAAFFEALKTEGAVLQLVGTDLTEADKTDEEAWFQICTQDAAGWTSGGDSKTEGIGETYEFTDEGYVMSVPASAYNDLLSACTVPTSDMQVVLNAGGSWTKIATGLKVRVVTGVDMPAAETETEAEATAEAEAPAETPAETAAEAAAETNEAPAAETSAPATGLALAVVPAVIALGAAAVSKKH